MPIIASAVQHSYDGDPIVAHGVENQIVADWKKTRDAGEVVAALSPACGCPASIWLKMEIVIKPSAMANRSSSKTGSRTMSAKRRLSCHPFSGKLPAHEQ